MKRKSKYAPIKAAIIRNIKDGYTHQMIAEKYQMPIGSISNLLKDYSCKHHDDNIRVCPNCKTKFEDSHVKYCWNCGCDVRTIDQIALSDVDALIDILATYPTNEADKGISIALELKDKLIRI